MKVLLAELKLQPRRHKWRTVHEIARASPVRTVPNDSTLVAGLAATVREALAAGRLTLPPRLARRHRAVAGRGGMTWGHAKATRATGQGVGGGRILGTSLTRRHHHFLLLVVLDPLRIRTLEDRTSVASRRE